MRRLSFTEINAFVAVAEHSSFAKAAAKLELSASRLSGTIRALEDDAGVRFFNRTTRSVALTEVGQRLFTHLRPLRDEYEATVASIDSVLGGPQGTLRLCMLPSAANFVLTPILASFLEEYPDICVEMFISTNKIDIVADHYDAGIGLRERIDRDMVALRVRGDIGTSICASPSYFARHPPPQTIADLRKHNCIRYRAVDGALFPWRLHRNGRKLDVTVEGSLIANDTAPMIHAALDGAGLLFVNDDAIAPYLADGRLVAVMQDYVRHFDGMYLYYPSRRQIPPHLQALIDFFKKQIRSGKLGSVDTDWLRAKEFVEPKRGSATPAC
jgi:DNA-binding transcriptional LysR family regulator